MYPKSLLKMQMGLSRRIQNPAKSPKYKISQPKENPTETS